MTQIEWCQAPGFRGRTWNPIAGCSLVSPGCTNCYAMATAAGIERKNTGLPGGGARHYEGLTRIVNGRPVWTGRIGVATRRLREPLRWGAPAFVFANSMSDLFHEGVPRGVLIEILAVMALAGARGHVFTVLTKRAAAMRAVLSDERVMRDVGDTIERLRAEPPCVGRTGRPAQWAAGAAGPLPHLAPGTPWWPLTNVIWGVSVEDQARADERVPHLLATPAWLRCVSVEPMLGPVDLTAIMARMPGGGETLWNALDRREAHDAGLEGDPAAASLDWVFGGFESGDRPGDAAWALDLYRQCASAGVPFFWKQNGSFLEGRRDERGDWHFPDGHVFRRDCDAHWRIAADAEAWRGGARAILNEWWASGDGRLLKRPASKKLAGAALAFDGAGFPPRLHRAFPRAVIEAGLAHLPDMDDADKGDADSVRREGAA